MLSPYIRKNDLETEKGFLEGIWLFEELIGNLFSKIISKDNS